MLVQAATAATAAATVKIFQCLMLASVRIS
jgi:hypothetical protein